MNPAGLYIHIPFCTQKCRYCDFYSVTQQGLFRPYSDNPRLIERILHDVRMFQTRYALAGWKTVYIGGGTPSLLSANDVCRLAEALCTAQSFPIIEFTVEANPEDIHPEWLAACAEGGVTRLSVGVQSFEDAVLEQNGRRGSGAKTRSALHTIKQHWKGAISCDLIAGLSGQRAESLAADVEELIAIGVEHISLYGLCSDEPLPAAREDFISDQLQDNFLRLKAGGYVQYEVSNFSLHDRYRSEHNQIYWRMEPYIGVGPAACGTLIFEDAGGGFAGAERFTGIQNTARWMEAEERSSVYMQETLDRDTFLEEVLLMGFRLADGIDRTQFSRRFGADICTYIGKTLSRWERVGQCRVLPDRVHLTEEGLFFLNRFLIDALLELEGDNAPAEQKRKESNVR